MATDSNYMIFLFKLKTGDIIKDFDRFHEPYVYRGIKAVGKSLSYINSRSVLKVIPELIFDKLDNQILVLKITIPFEDKIYDHQVLKNRGIITIGSEGGYLYVYSLLNGEMISSVWLDCKRFWGFDLLKEQRNEKEKYKKKSKNEMMNERQFLTPSKSINDDLSGGKKKEKLENEYEEENIQNKEDIYCLKKVFTENIYGILSIQDQSKNAVLHSFIIDEDNNIKLLKEWKKKLDVQFSEIKLGIALKGHPIVIAASEKGPSKLYIFVLDKRGEFYELKEDVTGKAIANYSFLFSSIVNRKTGTLITGGNSETLVCLRFSTNEFKEEDFSEVEDELSGLRNYNHRGFENEEFEFDREEDRIIFDHQPGERFFV